MQNTPHVAASGARAALCRQAALRKRGIALLVRDLRLKLAHEHVDLLLRRCQAALQGAQQRNPALIAGKAVLQLEGVGFMPSSPAMASRNVRSSTGFKASLPI